MTNATASARTNRLVLDFLKKTITGYGPDYKELVANMTAHSDYDCSAR